MGYISLLTLPRTLFSSPPTDQPVVTGGKTAVVAIGQSNANVIGLSSALSGANASLATAYPAVPYLFKCDGNSDPPVYTEYAAQALQPVTFSSAVRMGWQLSLMHELDWAIPGQFVCMQYALSSTSLSANWAASGTYPTGQPDNLANAMCKYVAAKMSEQGCTSVIFIWQQGENDAGGAGTSAAYAANLTALVNLIRTYFPAAPFLVARLNSDYVNSGSGPFTSTVQTQEANYVASDPLSALVNIDSVTTDVDHTHYTAVGYVTLGYLYSAPAAHLLGFKLKPHANFTVSVPVLTATFTDTSIDRDGSITSWSWTFGDGGVSSLQSPVHVYAGAGTYSVALTVTDTNGKTDTHTANVVVTGAIGGVTRDSTSLIYVPADATEWSTFLAAIGNPVGAPARLWLCQEASGNLAATIGGTALTAAGTPGYAATVTGSPWTRKCVTIAAGGVHRFGIASGTAPNPATTSQVWLALGQLIGTPAAARQWAGISSGAHAFQAFANNVPRLGNTVDGVSTSGTLNPVALGIGPMGMVHDRANSRAAVFDLNEWVTGTYSAATTDGIKGWGANGGTSAATECAYIVEWEGATAEAITTAAMRSLLQGMGFTVGF